jgi:hypothetical protein
MMTRRTIGCGLCPLRITLYGDLLRWWFCPLCGFFNTIAIGRESMTAAGPDSPLSIGVYRGAAPVLGPVQDYETFLGGRQVSHVLSYMADDPTWAQFEAGALQSSTNGPAGAAVAGDWAPLLGPRHLMLGVPACVQGTSWDDEASGVNDAHWASLAANLATAFPAGVYLRIAREFNTGYRWKVTPTLAAAHRAGWARIVGTMRAAGAAGNRYCWNPAIGQGNFAPSSGAEAAYPGNGVVDSIGLDVYDWGYAASPEVTRTDAERQAFWTHLLTQWDGLTGWRSFADSHGKTLCFPEWGLKLWGVTNTYDGGGDNDFFVQHMARWMKETLDPSRPLAVHAFWEDPHVGVSDPDSDPGRRVAVPQSRAAFLAAFGS